MSTADSSPSPSTPIVETASTPDALPPASVSAPCTTSTNPYTRQIAPQRSKVKPRWHTQPYMMFLALRSLPNRTGARQEIINAAVELDRKYSAERGWPRVFTGKTPMNSASACLTNNGDKYFIPFKPEGSRSTHFRLAYQPGDFDTAVKEYDTWMEKLINLDWPLCFGVPKEGAVPIHILEKEEQTQMTALEQAQGITTTEQAEKDQIKTGNDSRASSPTNSTAVSETPIGETNATVKEDSALSHNQNPSSTFDSKKRSPDPIESEDSDRNNKKVRAEQDLPSKDTTDPEATVQVKQEQETKVAEKMEQLDLASSQASTPASTPSTPAAQSSTAATAESSKVDEYRLEDLDLSNVPTSLDDVVRVDISTIPSSGNGLFAKIDLPASTPLGFYFGVPMTENEFDSLKDNVGVASHYSIMYRRTVLDATDENGQPYSDPNGRLYCPFHFMNEDPNGNITFITGSVVNQVICTTNRDIKAGEELFVYYGKDVDRFWAQGQEGSGSENGGEKEKKGGGNTSRSRGTSPVRREELTDRPRRSNVYKPARYTR
ncbi:hypothetical protein BGZ83_008093 [Gryganskiella cystojenkinii]|nr:hypothetical protein BGZ83_008093 [Gryganskiella cystojenkinii]